MTVVSCISQEMNGFIEKIFITMLILLTHNTIYIIHGMTEFAIIIVSFHFLVIHL